MRADYLKSPDDLRLEAIGWSDRELIAQQIFLGGIISGLEDLRDLREGTGRSLEEQAAFMINETRLGLQILNDVAEHRGVKFELEKRLWPK